MKLTISLLNALHLLLALAFCLAFNHPIEANEALEGTPYEAKPIEDLAYGTVLFEHFQDHDFRAITEILIALERGKIVNHKAEVEALQGRLYFRYGLQRRAEALLQSILAQPLLKTTRSEINYLLAYARYQVGDIATARTYLSQVDLTSDNRFANEQRLLSANLSMLGGDYQSASAQLEGIEDDTNLAAYARYNQGIALLGAGQSEMALDSLEAVFAISATNEVEKNLVDKTAVTLGYYHLQNNSYKVARRYLSSVRSQGQFAEKALLGLGWSYLNEEAFTKALVPWQKLLKMDSRDSAVQEALLAVPYAYQALEAYQQALDGYLNAAAIFGQEKQKIERVVDNVEMGDLIPLLKKAAGKRKSVLLKNWQSMPLDLAQSPENYYLVDLLADKKFFIAFREYQDLYHLAWILEHWQEQIPIFLEMLTNNRDFYQSKRPLVETALASIDMEGFEARLGALREQYNVGASSNDGSKFINAVEKEQLKQIRQINTRLKQLIAKEDLGEEVEKARLLGGYLMWKLNTNFIERRWQVKKSVQNAEAALSELRFRRQRLADSHDFALNRFEGFDERFELNKQKLFVLLEQVRSLMLRYESKLNGMAVAELEKRIVLLNQYQLQTDLSIARLHDKALKAESSNE